MKATDTNSDFIAYKLLQDGTILHIESNQLSSHFININIIAIYFKHYKHLYIWKGLHVPNELAIHIPKMEQQILERIPDLSILRHFTIEGAKPETHEFLSLLHINPHEFEQSLRQWDQFHIHTKDQIHTLELQRDQGIRDHDFNYVRNIINKIIDHAEKINDIKIITRNEEILTELLAKESNQKEEQIHLQVEQLASRFRENLTSQNFDQANEIVLQILNMLENSNDRPLKRHWEIQQIKLTQTQELYRADMLKKQQKQQVDINITRYQQLKTEIEDAWNNHQWRNGFEKSEELIQLLKKMQHFEELVIYNKKKFAFEKKMEDSKFPPPPQNVVQSPSDHLILPKETINQKVEPAKPSVSIEAVSQKYTLLIKNIELNEKIGEWQLAINAIDKLLSILPELNKSDERSQWLEKRSMLEVFKRKELMRDSEITQIKAEYRDLVQRITQAEDHSNWEQAIEAINQLLPLLEQIEKESETDQWNAKRSFFKRKLQEQLAKDTEISRITKNYENLINQIQIAEKNKEWTEGNRLIDNLLPLLSPINKPIEIPQWKLKKDYFKEQMEKEFAQEAQRAHLESQYQNLCQKIQKEEEHHNFESVLTNIEKIIKILGPLDKIGELNNWKKKQERISAIIEEQAQRNKQIQKLQEYHELVAAFKLVEKEENWKKGRSIINQILVLLPHIQKTEDHAIWKQKDELFKSKLVEQEAFEERQRQLQFTYDKLTAHISDVESKKAWRAGIIAIDELLPILSEINKENEQKDWQTKQQTFIQYLENEQAHSLEQEQLQNKINELKEKVVRAEQKQNWLTGISSIHEILTLIPLLDNVSDHHFWDQRLIQFQQSLEQQHAERAILQETLKNLQKEYEFAAQGQNWAAAMTNLTEILAILPKLDLLEEIDQWESKRDYVSSQLHQKKHNQYQELNQSLELTWKYHNWEESIQTCQKLIEFLPFLGKVDEIY